ncbi:MAG: PHP domain-containing protein [Actinomycetota bacterium]
MSLTNGELSELLAMAAGSESEHRQRALLRAGRAAMHWPEEAALLVEAGRSLTELRAVGPWTARLMHEWLDASPEIPEPPPVRRGFLTLAEVRTTLAEHPEYGRDVRGDLQMHTTYSDGKAPLREMAETAAAYGYEFVAVTDHSKGLPIARGMSEERLLEEVEDIDAANQELASSGARLRLVRSLEMNLSPQGEGDMERDALARLDLVLGAFHSKLRVLEDQTDRYVAAVRNPDVNVLAHPRGRRWNHRLGLTADWPRVFAAAAEAGTALEIDAYPDRQDLDVELLQLARESGCWISIGTDAHHPTELRFLEFGLAAAARASIPRERILNFLSRDQLLEWASERSRAA